MSLMSILKNTNLMKHYLSFMLTLVSILGLFALAWFKDVEITAVLPIVLASYIGARTIEKTVSISAASKDPNADTRQVIRDINGDSNS